MFWNLMRHLICHNIVFDICYTYVPEFQLASEQALCSISGWAPGKIFSGTIEKEGGQVNRPPILDGSNYDY